MSKNTKYYTQKTLEAWDEAAPIHASINTSLKNDVANPAYNNLNPDFDAVVTGADVKNKSVVQICCNNGIDLLSVKKKGAGRCLGIDGSKPFIDQAVDLVNAAGHPDIEFYHTDIYDLPDTFNNTFDVALVTVGVLGWMPDLACFMEICGSLLKPGGQLLVEELHPILNMYEEGEPSYLDESYFRTEPFVESDGLDYFSYQKYDGKENYTFPHSLSDILMAAISNNLQLVHIKELPYNVGNFCADLEHADHNPSLGINLAWRKI